MEAGHARSSLPPEIEQRSTRSQETTQQEYYAREAILRQIEDIEDYYLARRAGARRAARDPRELERDLKRRTKR
jgi:predicted DNA-binding protein